MTENKKLDMIYGAAFGAAGAMVLCTGCAALDAVLGHPGGSTPPGTPPPAIGILQTIALLCGQPWAVPIIGGIGGVIGCSTNAHHGVRNVAKATGRLIAKPFKSKKSKK